jgi:hypothetical protein
MLKEKRSPSGRRRQKHAPGFRCAPPCHGFCAPAVRRSGSLPVWRAVFTKGCLYGRQPSATPFLSAPRRPPWPSIFDFAVRWRSRPDIGRRRGLLWLRLGEAPKLSPQQPGGNGGWGRSIASDKRSYKRVSVRDSCLVARVPRRIRLREHQRQYPDQPLYYLASVQVDR